MSNSDTQVLKELDDWVNSDNARWCKISRPIGYAASCWSVILGHDNKKVTVTETTYFECELPPNFFSLEEHEAGLNKTISLALKKAREIGL